MKERLSGLILEIRHNQQILSYIAQAGNQSMDQNKINLPLRRLRLVATEAVLTEPPIPYEEFHRTLQSYWEAVRMMNALLDAATFGPANPPIIAIRHLQTALKMVPTALEAATGIEDFALSHLASMGVAEITVQPKNPARKRG